MGFRLKLGKYGTPKYGTSVKSLSTPVFVCILHIKSLTIVSVNTYIL